MRSGIAQSFLESVNTAIPPAQSHEEKDAITPDSGSCACCCRCGRSDSWKAPPARGHRRARSYTATRTGISELSGLDWEAPRAALTVELPKLCDPGQAPLESLPVEVLGMC